MNRTIERRVVRPALSLLLAAGTALAGIAAAQTTASPTLDWNRATQPLGANAQATAAKSPLGGLSAPASTLKAAATPVASPLKSMAPATTLPTQNAVTATPSPLLKGIAPAGATTASAKPGAASAGLFALDDRRIVMVGNRKMTAAELKAQLRAQLVALAGAPKNVEGGVRKLDLNALGGALGLTPAPAGSNGPPNGVGGILWNGFGRTNAATPTTSPALISAVTLGHGTATKITTAGSPVAAVRCIDNGPPTILQVAGTLKAGAKVTVYGGCFGDRAGRIEIIGPFPGGKLVPPFTEWQMTGVDLQIPADIRGVPDSVVALSVITADGKVSAAAQARFVAARVNVEVPEQLWAPAGDFETSSTNETVLTANGFVTHNAVQSGQTSRSLRINPQCALDRMTAVVLEGAVTKISGWDAPAPQNEAQVTIDWTATCTNTTTTKSNNYVIVDTNESVTVQTACRVAFEPRAWANCPAGIAP